MINNDYIEPEKSHQNIDLIHKIKVKNLALTKHVDKMKLKNL